MLLADDETNYAELSGTICTEPVHRYESYQTALKVLRPSGVADVIPISIERNLTCGQIMIDTRISLAGQFCSYNKYVGERSKLELYLLAEKLLPLTEESRVNFIALTGFLCKPPIYRTTPLGRNICEFILAVTCKNNRNNYIPCISWGKNARMICNYEVGNMLSLTGRMQSREYKKVLPNGTTENRVAYEISVTSIFRRRT